MIDTVKTDILLQPQIVAPALRHLMSEVCRFKHEAQQSNNIELYKHWDCVYANIASLHRVFHAAAVDERAARTRRIART